MNAIESYWFWLRNVLFKEFSYYFSSIDWLNGRDFLLALLIKSRNLLERKG